MFPTTVTIHNVSDLQKVMSVLYPTTGVTEIVDKSRDTPTKAEDMSAKKPAKTEAPAQAVGTQPTATEEAVAAPESQAEAPAAIDYPTLQKAVFALAGKSRDAASAVAASFGVKTFKELPADKWADALAAVNAKIEELGA